MISDGFYTVELNRTTWTVPNYYENLTPVGSGAYGMVCAAEDSRYGIKVAIKKFTKPFQTAIHAKRTYRELRLLRAMKHENVIELLNVFTPDLNPDSMQDVFFVTHLMGADMSSILKIQRLTSDQIQFLIYQVLRGLKYIHSAGIIHRDLKPSNIAVNEDCELKILDFGLARQTDAEMTGYVATRWYRAPEIMLNWMHYDQTVDVWSVACIMGELISGRTLFPGDDHINQLSRILEILGTPPIEFMNKIESKEARDYIASLPIHVRRPFSELFPTASPEAKDLLEKMLNIDPDYRPTAAEALAHPYFKQYHDEEDEPSTEVLEDPNFESDLTIEEWKHLVWTQIKTFVPPEIEPNDE